MNDQIGGSFGGMMLVACTLMLLVFLVGVIVCLVIGADIAALLCFIGCIVCVATCLWLAGDGS